jgi:hypothetical protein
MKEHRWYRYQDQRLTITYSMITSIAMGMDIEGTVVRRDQRKQRLNVIVMRIRPALGWRSGIADRIASRIAMVWYPKATSATADAITRRR